MHLLKLPVAGLLITLLLGACAQAETPRNMSPTQTNEERCTRKRSLGPQNAYADPAPIKQACVGPYLLELPQNYFSNQMGTEHDGSFSLALEYPALQPFKPGERMNLSADVSIRTVRIDYTYIDRVSLWDVMRKSYTRKDTSKAIRPRPWKSASKVIQCMAWCLTTSTWQRFRSSTGSRASMNAHRSSSTFTGSTTGSFPEMQRTRSTR